MDIRKYLEKNRIITDGSMGTWYDQLTGYRGKIVEKANTDDPEQIRNIHRAYIASGAQLIRANTFAANSMYFENAEKISKTIAAAWENALAAVAESDREDLWIAADLGPIDENETRSSWDVTEEYKALSRQFLELGASVFVFETMPDFRYIKEALTLIKSERPEAFIIVQFSFNRNGFTRSGMSVKALLSEASAYPAVDAVGFNCGVGPVHLYEMLKKQSFPSDKYLTALPNAGYPTELRGTMRYSANVPYYVSMMEKIADLGFDFVGGCCGTTPAHIRGLAELLKEGKRPPKKLKLPSERKRILSSQGIGEERTPLMQKLDRGEKVFAVELDPPFDANDRKLMEGAALLRDIDVDVITLADSPLARPRADAAACAIKMRYTENMEVMPHICCRDKNTIAHRAQLIGMHVNGLRHVLIVTGDPVDRGDRESIKSVFDFNSIKLMTYVQTMNREVFGSTPMYYGGALNQNNGSVKNIANRMRQKMDAGASWFMTQPVYGEEDIKRLRELKALSGGKILAGIMPLVSRKNALFIKNEMPGIHVPDAILEQYEEGLSRQEYEDVAVSISLDIMRRLRDVCDGYYMMTPFNRAALIRRIILQARKELP